jgi:BlaI family transcriptional regulator, penicillinase repressor
MADKSGDGKDLSARERQIMDIIYRRGQASVAEVMEELPEAPSYSTVRTFMGILEKKGHLTHKEEDSKYIYLPTVPQEKARASALKRLVQTFFNNSVDDTVLALLELKKNPDPEALARITRLIQKTRKEKKS